MRCDYGTENTSVASIQIAFRYFHNDCRAKEKSFMYGPSKANIVIQINPFYISNLRIYIFYRELKAGGHN